MNEKSSDQSTVEQFLIAEQANISQEFRRLRDEGIRRLSFFITLTSGILGGLLLLVDGSRLTNQAIHWVWIIALTALSFLGWETFRYLIFRDIGTDFNMRAMARIRRYFVDLCPSIKDYILWNTSDEPSHYVDISSTPSTIATISSIMSFLIAFDVGLIVNLFPTTTELAAAIGFLGFVVSVITLRLYAKRLYKSAVERARESISFYPIREDQLDSNNEKDEV